MKMKKIDLCFISDDGYVLPTLVAIESVRQHRHASTQVNIHIVTAELSKENESLFEGFSAENFFVSVVRASMDGLKDLHTFKEGERCVATPAALLKFRLGEIFPRLDRILYLDGDLIVCSDLYDLYSTPLKDNIVAAVKDSGGVYWVPKGTEHIKSYFNSGVMLLNLDKMRKGGYQTRLIEAKRASTDMSLMDQNVLNEVFDGSVLELHPKWNCLFVNLLRAYADGKFTMKKFNSFFSLSYIGFSDIYNKAAILHFSSKEKPWKYENAPLVDVWESVYYQSSAAKKIPLATRGKCNLTYTEFPWKTFAQSEKSASEIRTDAEELLSQMAVLRRQVARLKSELQLAQQKNNGVEYSKCESTPFLRVLIVGGFQKNAKNPFAYVFGKALEEQGLRVEGGVERFLHAKPGDYDIVHIQWPESLIGWKIEGLQQKTLIRLKEQFDLLRQGGTRIVYTRHNSVPHIYKTPLELELYRMMETHCDGVFHMGAYSQREYLRTIGNSNIRHYQIPHHVYPNVDVEIDKKVARRFLGLAETDKVVLAFGSFRRDDEKNLITIIESGVKVPHLRVIAPSLEGRAEYQGYLPNALMPLYFAASDIVFIQRVRILNSGNVPMACYFGRVCVGPNQGNVGEILQQLKNPIFDPNDSQSICAAVEQGLLMAAADKGVDNQKFALLNWNPTRIAGKAIVAYTDLLLQQFTNSDEKNESNRKAFLETLKHAAQRVASGQSLIIQNVAVASYKKIRRVDKQIVRRGNVFERGLKCYKDNGFVYTVRRIFLGRQY